MIAKLYNALAVVAIATMLAAGGSLAFLAGSGRLSAERVDTIAAVLRGELDDHGEEDTTVEAAEEQSEQPRGQSADQVHQARLRDHLRSQALERAKRDVEARQCLLDQALQHLINEQEHFVDDKTKWSERRDKLTTVDQDAGFQRELEYVAGLPPKQAKEHVIRLWKKHTVDAVRLINNLDVGRGKRILAQFKTAEELEMMSQLLEQLRLLDVEGNADESGTTDGNAAP